MKKILLIEDNDEIRENTAEILELASYKVFTAGNGKEGLSTALREHPDLIVCDIMMPVLDGYAVLHAVHKNENLRNTPFIFLTAKTERDDFRKGMELGADDYIMKPFTGTELLTAIESRLRKMDQIREDLLPGIKGMSQLLSAAGVSDAEKMLVENRNVNTYKKKQVIYTEGNRPSRLYYVLRGKVKTFKRNEEGKELVMEIFHEGDFFGYTALLEGTNYRETADVLENAEVAVIPKEDFEELVNNHPGIARKFLKLLSKNITELEEHLVKLAYNSLRKKVADALLTLMSKYTPEADGLYAFNISRENLATLAGTATESLIRTLGDFRTEKIIDIKEGQIQILDEKKLRGMVN